MAQKSKPILAPLCLIFLFLLGAAGRASENPNFSPKVAVSFPGENAVFHAGDSIPLVADTADVDGHVVAVEFFSGQTSLGKRQALHDIPPGAIGSFDFKWANVAEGEYAVTARATDNQGSTTVSTPIHIIVKSAEPEFAVKFMNVVEGQIEDTGDDILLMAIATRPILSMEFFANGKSLGHGESVPRDSDNPTYITRKDWEGVPAGKYELTVTAVTERGAAAASEKVHIVVRDGGNEISVKITQPANGATFSQGEEIVILANTGLTPVTTVEFFADGHSLGFGDPLPTFAPGGLYQFVWRDAPVGEHKISAKATDSEGDFEVDSVVIKVTPHEGSWKLAMISPQDGALFVEGDDIVLSASVNLTPVVLEFFANDHNVGEGQVISLQPGPGGVYQCLWRAAPVGDFAVTARVTGADGSQARSEPVHIKVRSEKPAPHVRITAPGDGASFPHGATVTLTAQTSPGITAVEFFANGHDLGPGVPLPVIALVGADGSYEFIWKEAPDGIYKISAQGLTVDGVKVMSDGVRISVNPAPPRLLTIHRQLPAGYIPGSAFVVKLVVSPSDHVNAYALEETAPTGWEISEISDGGTFDTIHKLIKFGPFTDRKERSLTYRVFPSLQSDGRQVFSGQASANGIYQKIQGDVEINVAQSTHPADYPLPDQAITLNEVTAYAAAWKQEANWPVEPFSIPVDYVTRAGLIWSRSELYTYVPEAGRAPACWVPAVVVVDPPVVTASAPAPSQTKRKLSFTSAGVEVSILAQPPKGTRVYAVEERVSPGITLKDISDEGAFAKSSGVLRWGPFYDDQAREFKYLVVWEAGSMGSVFFGAISFDGLSESIDGVNKAVFAEATEMTIQGDTAAMAIRVQPSGRVSVLEFSPTLVQPNWQPVQSMPEGTIFQDAPMDLSRGEGYYRLRFP